MLTLNPELAPGARHIAEVQDKLIGVQSCLWSENLSNRTLFDHLTYPRLSAIAETAWSPREAKDFARFMAIQTLMPRANLGQGE